MDIETALFRTYEASLTPCVHEHGGRSCSRLKWLGTCQVLAFTAAAFFVIVATSGHYTFFSTSNEVLTSIIDANARFLQNATADDDGMDWALLFDDVPPKDNATSSEMVVYISVGQPDHVQYVFALSSDVGRLPAATLRARGFPIVRATVQLQCDSANPWLAGFPCRLLSTDAIVVGQLMQAFPYESSDIAGRAYVQQVDEAPGDVKDAREGYVRNLVSGSEFVWDRSSDVVSGIRLPAMRLYNRVLAVLQSVFLFFLVSNSSALFFRVVLSSGLVLMYALLGCLRRCRLSRLPYRVLSHAFPWFGAPIEEYARAGRSPMPFMFANLAFTILFMVMFEAIQIMYSLWLMPNPLLVFVRNSVFFVMMLLEYCTLVYARTKASITHFPRFIFAGFLCLHLYLLCTPCGFYDIAFAAFASYALGAGLWFVRNCEVPGLRAGVVSDIQPRALDTRMPGLQPSNTVPALWSVLLPIHRTPALAVNAVPPPLPAPQPPAVPAHAVVVDVVPAAAVPATPPATYVAQPTVPAASPTRAARRNQANQRNVHWADPPSARESETEQLLSQPAVSEQ